MAIPTGRDQRRHKRYDIIMEVELTYPDGEKQLGKTKNISEGGLFLVLHSETIPPLGEMVYVHKTQGQQINIELPSNEAIVVHKDDNGIGLAFVDMDMGLDF